MGQTSNILPGGRKVAKDTKILMLKQTKTRNYTIQRHWINKHITNKHFAPISLWTVHKLCTQQKGEWVLGKY